MARSNGGSDDSSNVAEDVGRIFKRLTGKDLWVVILVGAVAGGNSGLFTKAPDRWTGTQQMEYAEKIERRLSALERANVLNHDHIRKSQDGYKRIERCEQVVAAMEADCSRSQQEIREIRQELRR